MNCAGKLFLIVACFCFFRLAAQEPNIVLGRPTSNNITLNILFNSNSNYFIEYGSVPGAYPQKSLVRNAEANVPDVVELTGLSSNTRYFYRISYKPVQDVNYRQSPEYSFQTWRPPGGKFTFTIEADPHPYDKKGYHPLWEIALDNQFADKPDFMIDMGDTHGDDRNPSEISSAVSKQLHLNNRAFFGRICHSAPLFFCLGNHEGENGYYLLQNPAGNIAMYGTNWRKYYYSNPFPNTFYSGNTQVEPFNIGYPENYYAWEWGDALFVVLDMYRYSVANAKPVKWDWTIGKTQYDWFKQTLEKSKARYKFVFAHHVLGEGRGAALLAKQFEWGGAGSDFTANRPGWELPIHQLMVKNNVNLFFQGHDHLYAREELDGLIYQEIPMPSDSSYMLGMIANGDAYGGVKLSGSGHLKVTVSPEKVQVDYVLAVLPKDETPIRKNRQIAYSYSLNSPVNAVADKPLPLFQAEVKAWPNPFKNWVEIQFSLSRPSHVELVFFDNMGRQVDQIVTGNLEPGSHTIKWDALKNNLNLAGSSIYTCLVITSEGQKAIRLNHIGF